MSTAQQPRTRQQQPHSDLQFGPVSAAIVASAVAVFMTTLGKFVGLPPWLALAAGTATAASMYWAGKHRRPRPLSTHSLVYRPTAMMVAAGWMFWQLADFPDTAGVGAGLVATVVALAMIPAGFAGMKLIPGAWKAVAPLTTGLVATFLVVSFGPRLWAWIVGCLTVTDRLPHHNMQAVGSWLGYAALSVLILAVPTAVLGVAFATREKTADDELVQARRDALSGSPDAQSRAMQALLCTEFNEWEDVKDPATRQTVGRRPTIRIVGLPEFWANGAGEEYLIDLRGNTRGTTLSKINASMENLVTKLGLPDGCGVEVLRAKKQGRGFARLSVARVNKLEEVVNYPALLPRSILNPLPVGVLRSGKEIGPVLREHSAYVWGQKGSGKTVTIFDLITGGLQCTNALVWGIDLNGGAAFAPFLSGFEEGLVDRPCVDWVATDEAEVRRMAQVALEIAKDRKVYYRKLKKLHNVNLMPIGNGAAGQPPPEILIIIDEGAEVLGIGGKMTDDGRAAREALDAIMRLARDAAINIVFSGLRATADVADPAFKAGTSVRIGMRVSDQQELAYGFGDWKLDPAEIPYQGSGFICIDHQEDTQVFKAYFLDPNRMEEVGITTTPWRPYLDDRGVQVGDRLYAERWQRTARKIWDNPRPEIVTYGGLFRPPGAGTSGAAPAAGPTSGGGTTTAVLDRDTPLGSDPAQRATAVPVDGDGFDALMATAAKHTDMESDEPPPPPPGYTPPAGGDPKPDDGEGEKTQAEYDREFAELARRAAEKVDLNDPRTWHGTVPVPPAAELAAVDEKVNSRAVLESLVRMAGPDGIGFAAMLKALHSGGDWGPAVPISKVSMLNLLRKPGSDDPVEWLAPRAKGEPYVHISHYRPPADQ